MNLKARQDSKQVHFLLEMQIGGKWCAGNVLCIYIAWTSYIYVYSETFALEYILVS